MRKESREMSADWAREVFDKAPYVTVSMVSCDGTPYALPLSLVRTDDNTFYFHCAREGRKLDILKENPKVCLCAVSKCKPTVGPKDNSFTLEYQSAIAYGSVTIINKETEKITALRAICQRFLPKHMHSFEQAIARSLDRTTVVRISLTEEPVGKRKQYDSQGNEMKWQRME